MPYINLFSYMIREGQITIHNYQSQVAYFRPTLPTFLTTLQFLSTILPPCLRPRKDEEENLRKDRTPPPGKDAIEAVRKRWSRQ